MSPAVFLDAELDRDIQNWAKILGMGQTGVPTRKIKLTHPGFQLTRVLGLFNLGMHVHSKIYDIFCDKNRNKFSNSDLN